ncbi:MAG: RHS repeat-associated core domain-containing protein [Bacteroidales bacterium]
MNPFNSIKINTAIVCVLLLGIPGTEISAQSSVSRQKTEPSRGEARETTVETELYPVVYSREALDYYARKEQEKDVSLKSSTVNPVPKSTAAISATATASLLSGGDPLSHIPILVPVNTSYRVGSIPIQSSVTPAGGVTYSVPVACAAGRNGLQPGISVGYNSMGGNGPVGTGWGISGLSSITRVPFNRYYNGYTAPMQLNASDPFVLDGNRILTTSTTGQFETEQGNIKVVPVMYGSAVAYFNVYYPDGTTAIFGFTGNQANQMFYPITKITDRLGNVIEFSYISRNNYYYPENIQYGKNLNNGHYANIKFYYKIRPDILTTYYGGKAMKEDYLLDKIISYSGSDVLHTYTFTYVLDRVSLLDRIDCDNLNPLKFYYGYSDNQTASLNKTEGTLATYFNQTVPVITKKGKFDAGTDDDALMIYPLRNNAAVYWKDGSLFSHSTYYYYTEYNSAQTLLVYQSLAESFPLPVSLTAGTGFMELTSGDFDGKPGEEVVKINNYVYNNTYDRVSFAVYQPNIYSGLGLSYTRTWDLNPALTHYDSPKSYWPKNYYTGDFNGDGRIDVLCVSMNNPLGQTDKKSKCTLLDLYSNAKMYDAFKFEFDKSKDFIIPMDFDGDGKTDICHFNATGMYVYSFSGSGTTQSLNLVSSTTAVNRSTFTYKTVLSGDLNSDGIVDLIVTPNKSYYTTYPVSIPVWAPEICPYCGGEYPITEEYSHTCRHCYNYIEESYSCMECGSTLQSYCDGVPTNGTGPCCPVHGSTIYRDIYQYIDNGNLWDVYYGTGNMSTPFSKVTQSFLNVTDNDTFISQDVDQDGSYDIVRKSGSSVYVYPTKNGALDPDSNSMLWTYLSYSSSRLVPSSISQPNFYNFLLGIYNEKLTKINTTRNESKQRLLTGSVTSTGIVQRNYYNQLNDGYGVYNPAGVIYTRGYNATFPYENYMGPLWVTSMQESFHNGILSGNVAYSYVNAVIHRQGLGFRGFEKVTTTNLMNGHTVEKTINPLNYGIPVRDNSTTAETTYQATATVASNKKLTVQVNSATSTDKLKNTTKTIAYTYDTYNNPLTENINYGGGITTLTSQTYINSTGTPYILGVPGIKTVTRTRGGSSWIDKEEILYFANYLPKLKRTYTGTGGTLKTGEVRWTYDANGNLTSEVSAPYDVTDFIGTSYTYDATGRYPASENNTLSQTTTYTNYDKYGNARTITNHKGQSTYRISDQWGQLTSVSYPEGVTESVSFDWGSPGIYVVTSTVTGKPATKIYYDALGRDVRQSNQRFDGTWQNIDKAYDNLGRIQKVSLPFKGTTADYWNSYAYDSYDRPTSITESSGRVTSWSYSGNNITETKSGISSTKYYDASGILVGTSDPGGTITYTVRPDGQPLSTTVMGNTVTSFGYDSYGRQNSITDPSAGLQTFSYSFVSNLLVKTSTNANGSVITTNHDRYGRITNIIRPEFSTSYSYNSDGLMVTESSTNSTSRSYEYDAWGRTSKTRESIPDGKYLEKSYTYSGGNVAEITYTSQSGLIGIENYVYAYGHNTELKLNNNSLIWKLTGENDFGQPTNLQTGLLTRTLSYNAYGSPTRRVAGSLQDFSYNFDPQSSNLLNRNDNKRNLTENFQYDNLNRLSMVSSNAVTYSPSGNLTYLPGTGTMAYGSTTKPYAVTMLTPDGNAVPVRDQQASYTSFNRPASITENGVNAAFTYNADGERVRMSVMNGGSSILTRYYLSGQYEIDAPANIERLYLGGDAYSAPAIYVKEAGVWKIYYICRDYLGSITHIANADGTLKQEVSYTAWGRMRNPATQAVYLPGTEPALFLGRGYTGHEYLPWFGLINMNARLYDPALGRFLAPDPYVQVIDFTQSYNRYSYCLNNPLIYSDPSGELGLLLSSLIYFAGQYVINWLNNVINQKMTPKEAFQNTPIVMGIKGTIPYKENKPPTSSSSSSGGSGITEHDLNELENGGVGGPSGSQKSLYYVDPGSINYLNPTGLGVRFGDSQGRGIYGASRSGGSRYHLGLDFLSVPFGDVYAVTDGTAYYWSGTTSEGYSYGAIRIKPTPRIAGPSNLLFPYVNYVDILYINIPTGSVVGQTFTVTSGQIIGTAMDLSVGYPTAMSKGMQNHIHLQINYNIPGTGFRFVNPYPFFTFRNYVERVHRNYYYWFGR